MTAPREVHAQEQIMLSLHRKQGVSTTKKGKVSNISLKYMENQISNTPQIPRIADSLLWEIIVHGVPITFYSVTK